MRWDDFRQSENVEDRRGSGGDDGGFGGGGGGFPIPGGRGGLGIGAILILGLVGWVVGIDPRQLIGMVQEMQGGGGQFEQPFNEDQATPRRPPRQSGQPGAGPGERADAPTDDRDIRFVKAILGNTEDVWKVVLPEQMGVQYQNPRMVVFSGATRSGCGTAQSAMGPFYCPRDKTVYLDMSFFKEMKQKFRVSSEFAYAYVLAHEVGHHVQNLLGVIPKVEKARRGLNEVQNNQLSVRVELMADCLAGVWATRSNEKFKFLQEGDIEAAVKAAEAIGDDRLQKQAQGYVVPDSFTHGSSAQRVRAMTIGMKSAQITSCDTFKRAPDRTASLGE
jgi:predicted metalloprotease